MWDEFVQEHSLKDEHKMRAYTVWSPGWRWLGLQNIPGFPLVRTWINLNTSWNISMSGVGKMFYVTSQRVLSSQAF
jgi:hypothetical protein